LNACTAILPDDESLEHICCSGKDNISHFSTRPSLSKQSIVQL
jgi:hypothetical protein